jgi:MFS family permease
VAFAANGFAFASWASRIPQVRTKLHLRPSELGLVLLAIAIGSLVALPLSGTIINRVGPRRTVSVTAALVGLSLGTVAAGYLIGVAPVVLGLVAFGFVTAAWDVAMNVHAAIVERRSGRPIMSRFHAGFSLGMVGGALVGAAMVALQVPVTLHLGVVAVVVALGVPVAVRDFLAESEPAASPAPGDAAGVRPRGDALQRWREPRTILIGLFVLSFAFSEGVGYDWISVAAIDGHHTRAVVGTLGFALFLTSMTAGRWFGPQLLDRFGRVPVVRVLALTGIAGVMLFVYAPSVWLAFVGPALWGVGVSLGFPSGMSAASEEPAAAPGRVSVVSSIGYTAFLAGPPVIGFLGARVTVLHALTIVAVTLTFAWAITGSVRSERVSVDGWSPSLK